MKSRTIKKEEDVQDICSLYKTGMWTMKLLAEKYHCSPFVIKNILLENGVEIVSKTKRANLQLKENYFEVIDSSEKAYFAGLLFTDGNIHIDKKGIAQISLELHIKDIAILHKFKSEVNSDSKITYRKRDNTEMCTFRVYSRKMAEDLGRLNIIPRKTKKANHIPVVPKEYEKDLIRGMIDGDGAIYLSEKKYYHLTFCSYSYNVCKELQDKCDVLAGIKNGVKILKDKGKEIYRVHYNTQEKVKQLVTVLYKDSTCCLARKYDLARSIFEDKNEEDIV